MKELLSRPRLVFTTEEVLHYLHRTVLAFTSWNGVSTIGFHRGGVRVEVIDFRELYELYRVTKNHFKHPEVKEGVALYHLNRDARELVEFTYYPQQGGDWVRTTSPVGYDERPAWLMHAFYPKPVLRRKPSFIHWD